jgi:hypothetical protein
MRVLLGEHVGDQWLLAGMPQCLTYPDERRQIPSRGPTSFLLLAHRRPERGSQPVGSLVTNASVKPPLKEVSKAPGVVG